MKMQEELNNMDVNHSPNSIQEKENKQNILKQLQKEKFYYSIQLFQKTPYYKIIQELKQKRRIEERQMENKTDLENIEKNIITIEICKKISFQLALLDLLKPSIVTVLIKKPN